MRQYSLVIEYDPAVQAYSVDVPVLPGCTSMGATLEEAIANAREAIALYIEGLQEMGRPIPVETNPPQVVRIAVAA